MTPAQTLCFTEVHRFLAGLFEGDLHAKRVLSLANATLGVLKTASLAWFKKCHFQVTPEIDRALMVKEFLILGVTLI